METPEKDLAFQNIWPVMINLTSLFWLVTIATFDAKQVYLANIIYERK